MVKEVLTRLPYVSLFAGEPEGTFRKPVDEWHISFWSLDWDKVDGLDVRHWQVYGGGGTMDNKPPPYRGPGTTLPQKAS